MARGDAMLTAVQAPCLRWRQIAPEALVLGHGQRLESVDLAACRAAGVNVYRRATGGTAVLSGPELLGLDLVLPAGHPLALADITRSYVWLGEALSAGLRSLGVDAEAVLPDEARAQAASIASDDPLRLACYATLSPHEIVSGGRKLVGLAQARRRAGVLLQAGVLLRWQPERLVPLLAIAPARRAETVGALRARAVGLDALAVTVDAEVLAERLSAAVAEASGVTFMPAEWTEAERAAMTSLRPRYAPVDAAVAPP
jgi:lipoate-protein ligase A